MSEDTPTPSSWRDRAPVPLSVFGIQLLVGIVAAATPALRNGGYKSALVLGVIGSLVLPIAWMWRRWGRDPDNPIGRLRRCIVYLGLALVPPAMALLSALIFTKGCEIEGGLAMIALGFLPGALLAFALTEVADLMKSRWRYAIYGGFWLLLLVHGVYWFMSEPVYQVTHPLAGMLLGPPNEKPDVAVARAAWFALEVHCWSALILALVGLREVGLKAASPWRYGIIAISVVGLCALIAQDADLGYRIDGEFLREGPMAAVSEVEGIRHVMSPLIPTDARPWIKVDAEFEQHRQKTLFGLTDDQTPKTTIYWFRNRKAKEQLTGAGRTKFAKVHLGELYVSVDQFPVRTLAHELAHVTSGAFSDTLLKVPGRLGGVWYNPALVEGFAVAVAWSDYPLSPHEQARIAIDKKRAPPLEDLFSPLGFATTNLSVAYRISGSFVRFCLDTYGDKPVAAWYESQDFESAFGRPLSQVDAEWRAFLQDDARAARFESDKAGVDKVQSRPSIAQESCGRHPDEKALADAIRARADDEVERVIARRIAADGDSAALYYTRMKYKAERTRYDCDLPEDPEVELDKRLAGRYAWLRAMTLWGRGDLEGASAAMAALPKSIKRSDDVIMARLLLEDGYKLHELYPPPDVDASAVYARLWRTTKHPVFGYKLARQLRSSKRWATLVEVVKELSWAGIAFPDGLSGTVPIATEEIRGYAAFVQRDWTTARRAWTKYVELAPSEGRRAYGQTWIERTDFFESRADRLPTTLPRF